MDRQYYQWPDAYPDILNPYMLCCCSLTLSSNERINWEKNTNIFISTKMEKLHNCSSFSLTLKNRSPSTF